MSISAFVTDLKQKRNDNAISANMICIFSCLEKNEMKVVYLINIKNIHRSTLDCYA